MTSPDQESSEAPTASSAPVKRAGATLTIVAGDHQTAALVMTDHGFPMAMFDPVAVVLRDADGAVLGGRPVAWSVGETPGLMGVQMDPQGSSPCMVLTDEQGVATLNKMRGKAASAFYGYGPFTLVASHGSASVAAHMTVATPIVLKPVIASGDNQSVARSGTAVPDGEAVFAPVRVLLKDSTGQVAPGIDVVFEAVGPPGMEVHMEPDGGAATAVVTSDADGIATLDLMGGNSMVCSGGAGEFKVVITPDDTKPIVSHHTVAS